MQRKSFWGNLTCCSNEHKSDKKAKTLIAHMEKVVLVCIEDQYRQNILLSWSLILSKAPNTLQLCEGWENCRRKFEASRSWFMRLRREAISITSKSKMQLQVLCRSCSKLSEDLTKIINELLITMLNNRFWTQTKQPSFGRWCHLGLSQLERGS